MDWNDFAKRLTLELSRLPVKAFLIVQGPSGLPYAQAMRSEGVLDAEAVGSAFLPRPLAPRQERRLRALGWEPRTRRSARTGGTGSPGVTGAAAPPPSTWRRARCSPGRWSAPSATCTASSPRSNSSTRRARRARTGAAGAARPRHPVGRPRGRAPFRRVRRAGRPALRHRPGDRPHRRAGTRRPARLPGAPRARGPVPALVGRAGSRRPPVRHGAVRGRHVRPGVHLARGHGPFAAGPGRPPPRGVAGGAVPALAAPRVAARGQPGPAQCLVPGRKGAARTGGAPEAGHAHPAGSHGRPRGRPLVPHPDPRRQAARTGSGTRRRAARPPQSRNRPGPGRRCPRPPPRATGAHRPA